MQRFSCLILQKLATTHIKVSEIYMLFTMLSFDFNSSLWRACSAHSLAENAWDDHMAEFKFKLFALAMLAALCLRPGLPNKNKIILYLDGILLACDGFYVTGYSAV